MRGPNDPVVQHVAVLRHEDDGAGGMLGGGLLADGLVNGRVEWLSQRLDAAAVMFGQSRFQPLGDHRWELRLASPLTSVARGTLTVAISDRVGNWSRIERTFSIGAK